MKRFGRWIFFAAANLLWLGALAAGCEVYEVLHTRHERPAVEAYGLQRGAETAQKNDEVIARYASAPPEIGLDVRARESFAALDEPARKAFVTERHECVVLCDPVGRIRSVFAASGDSAAAQFGAALASGTELSASLPAHERADASAALRAALAGNAPQYREYVVPSPTSPEYALQFTFQPYVSQGEVGVFVRDSMWEVPWQRFRKNVHQNDAYDFHTNHLGFRGGDIEVPKPPGVFRILCIGGSTTAEGLTDELTYPAMLQRKLREHFHSDKIEVVNGGIFAATTGLERKRLGDYLAVQPDLLIHYNFVNDVTYQYALWASDNGLFSLLKNRLARSLFLRHHFNMWLLPGRGTLESAIGTSVVDNIRAILEGARTAKAEMAICSFACPDVGHVPAEDIDYFNLRLDSMIAQSTLDIRGYAQVVETYNGLIRDLCRREQLIYVPVSEELRGGTELFTDICHLRPWAIERKAEAVFRAIRDHVSARLSTGPEQRP